MGERRVSPVPGTGPARSQARLALSLLLGCCGRPGADQAPSGAREVGRRQKGALWSLWRLLGGPAPPPCLRRDVLVLAGRARGHLPLPEERPALQTATPAPRRPVLVPPPAAPLFSLRCPRLYFICGGGSAGRGGRARAPRGPCMPCRFIWRAGLGRSGQAGCRLSLFGIHEYSIQIAYMLQLHTYTNTAFLLTLTSK